MYISKCIVAFTNLPINFSGILVNGSIRKRRQHRKPLQAQVVDGRVRTLYLLLIKRETHGRQRHSTQVDWD